MGRAKHWFGHFAINDHRVLTPLRRALGAVRHGASANDVDVLCGFGSALWQAIDPASRDELGLLHPLAPIEGAHPMPATQEAWFLWLQCDGADRVIAVLLDARRAFDCLASLRREDTSFVSRDSRDLTGFLDGTANPTLHEAPDVALVGQGPGRGGSYVLQQQWQHDLAAFNRLTIEDQERVIGRTKVDSRELDHAPDTAHIRRVELRDIAGRELPIFRRSVPWGSYEEQGLSFLAFSCDPSRFTDILSKMFGASADGLTDGLVAFTAPVSGAIYGAPPEPVLRSFTS